MPSLKEVRNRIQSVVSTQQITKAMKMVAAAKLRRAQDGITQLRPYASKLDGIITNLNQTAVEGYSNPFAEERPVEKVLVIAITSDRGLCGAFNTNVLKSTVSHIKENYAAQDAKGNVTVLTLGKKGLDFFNRRNYKHESGFATVFENLSFDGVKRASEFAMAGFKAGDYDRVDVVYNEFKNVATQILRVEQLLPFKKVVTESKVNNDYIFEPDMASILDELIPKSVNVSLYRCVRESYASEMGARMTAMDKATDNAGELIKSLKLTYNRTRQAAITKEILEIVGGAEALAAE